MVVVNYSDFEWSAEADLSKYAGKWIAILDKKVIAVAGSAVEASRIAKEKLPSANAFLKKIPKLAYQIL